MKRLNLWALLVSISVLAAWAVQAQDVVTDPAQTTQQTTQGQSQAKKVPDGDLKGPVSQLCAFCFTCGGAYPIFAGGISEPVGSMPSELDSGCSGVFHQTNDTFPFLCCSF